ncbi:MAG: hypothetical protein JWM00_807 [Candidatus Saccharibacteria bacterium]|nr:hypothetical protein [Candidatus Saccharibacteria bacterium]
MLASLLSEDYNTWLMSNPEINTVFREMVGDLDLRKDGMFEFASLEDYKDKLYTRLTDHLLALAPIDVYNPEAYDDACKRLNDWVNEDFEDLSGDLERGSEVVTCAEVPYVVDGGDSELLCLRILPPGVRIRGKAFGLAVGSMPDATQINGDLARYDGAVDKFGLGILILDAKIEDADGSAPLAPETLRPICIPLSSVRMPLKRVVPLTIEDESEA